MSDDLKGCPFCGGSNIRRVYDDGSCWERCMTCFATGPVNRKRDEAGMPDWNTRPSAGPVEGLADELQAEAAKWFGHGHAKVMVHLSPEQVRTITAALRRRQPSAWRAIAEHDGSMKEVLGLDAKGDIHKTWYFAPSSRTRDWWIVGNRNRKWHPTHFMELPPSPPENEAMK